jgi:hypothetical protein
MYYLLVIYSIIYLSICLFIYIIDYYFIYLFIYLFISSFVYLFMYFPINLFIFCLSILSLLLFIYLKPYTFYAGLQVASRVPVTLGAECVILALSLVTSHLKFSIIETILIVQIFLEFWRQHGHIRSRNRFEVAGTINTPKEAGVRKVKLIKLRTAGIDIVSYVIVRTAENALLAAVLRLCMRVTLHFIGNSLQQP